MMLAACSDLLAMDGLCDEGRIPLVLIEGVGALLTCHSAQLVCSTPAFLEGIKKEPGPGLPSYKRRKPLPAPATL